MKLLQLILPALFIFLSVTTLNAQENKALSLVIDGKPKATIVLSDKPTKAAQTAAFELQWHIAQMTGATLPIVKDGKETAGTRILVGESEATKALGIEADFPYQEYLVKCLPDTLVLIGRDKADFGAVDYAMKEWYTAWSTLPDFWDEQATLYAAYDFLQTQCGVRWLTPAETGTVIPKQTTLTVNGNAKKRRPGFYTRNTCTSATSEWYFDSMSLWKNDTPEYKQLEAMAFADTHTQHADNWEYIHAKRFRLHLFLLRNFAGGEKSFANHSLYRYYDLYWEKIKDHPIFKEHRPQYFAKGYEGKPPQMCYTNKEFIDLVAQDAKDYFDKGGYAGPDAGSGVWPGYHWGENFFTVEPMDNNNFCQCDDCRKFHHKDLDHQGVFSNGRDSDYFFNFVNEIANRVKATNPDKHINTLAYMSHAWPPKEITLEPNVAVHFCFTNNRMPWCTREYENEMAAYHAWRKDTNRWMYLWLYDTFPLEIANGGHWKCFPGYAAHTIDKHMKMFARDNIRGMFFCGFGQEVDAYIYDQLLFDPDQNVDILLDRFFTGVYGTAAAPMKEFYQEAERAYSDPKNYPDIIADGAYITHQTEDFAWGYLGREDRMKKLAALVEKAKALAATDAEKTNVAMFELGVWKYMQQGRKAFLERAAAWYGGVPTRKVPAIIASTMPPEGDPTRVDWSEATAITLWRSQICEPTLHRITARLTHDERFLYMALEERFGPNAVNTREDGWQLIFAKTQNKPYRQMLISPKVNMTAVDCTEVATDGATPWESKAKVKVVRGDKLTVYLALPLTELLPGGVDPNGVLCMNIIHRAPEGDDQPMWAPTFGALDAVNRLGSLRLESIKDPTIFTTPANAASLRQGLVGEWHLDEGAGDVTKDSSGNGLDGKLANDPVWVEGKIKNGLQGCDYQWVDIGNDPKVRLTRTLTMMAWINPTQFLNYPAVMGKGYEVNAGYGLQIRGDWTLWFELGDTEGKRNFYNPTDLALEPGAWNHVAATYDGKMMRIYINGHEAGEGMTRTITIKDTDVLFRLGFLGSYGCFRGAMDEARLYNRALSQQEIATIYRAEKARK